MYDDHEWLLVYAVMVRGAENHAETVSLWQGY